MNAAFLQQAVRQRRLLSFLVDICRLRAFVLAMLPSMLNRSVHLILLLSLYAFCTHFFSYSVWAKGADPLIDETAK